LIRFGLALPDWLAWLSFGAMLFACVLAVAVGWQGDRKSASGWRGACGKGGALLFVGGFAIAVILDQHRLQPWAYHLALIAILASAVEPKSRLMLWLMQSIYLFSALGKLDHSFAQSVGLDFCRVIDGWFATGLADDTLRRAAYGLPLGELLIAMGLAIPAVRKPAMLAAIAAHFALILLLGPTGLGHHAGVLVWNVFFAGLWLLLWLYFPLDRPTAATEPPDDEAATAPSRTSTGLTGWIVRAAIFLPLLEPLGLFDHWPAWGLYSPRNSRAVLYVHDAMIGEVPAELEEFLLPPDDTGWRRVDIDQWSLESLDVPIYPQDRFQWGVAVAAIERLKIAGGFRLEVYSMADRTSGNRTLRSANSPMELDDRKWPWRMNGRPRPTSAEGDGIKSVEE
jgi:hypothetical protein